MNTDLFFAEPIAVETEARNLAGHVIARLLIWVSEADSLQERGVRSTIALYCIRPDLVGDATLEELGDLAGRSKQAVHQLAESFRETTGMHA